eukprot:CCRYP_005800-RA/>CCRYP_005800-RA protein AED:0.18 eAED:0.20 QI:0/0/0/1/0/0/2/0/136
MVMAWEQALRDHGNRNGNTLGEEARVIRNTASDKLLERFAQLKRDKYEEACLESAKTSLPCATLWMAWHARPPAERLMSLLLCQVGSQYSEMVNFIRTRMSLAVVRSNTLLPRRKDAHMAQEAPEDGSAIAAAPHP